MAGIFVVETRARRDGEGTWAEPAAAWLDTERGCVQDWGDETQHPINKSWHQYRVVEYAPVQAVPADVKAEIERIERDWNEARGLEDEDERAKELVAFDELRELAERLAAELEGWRRRALDAAVRWATPKGAGP
jgi:hypothetical protein